MEHEVNNGQPTDQGEHGLYAGPQVVDHVEEDHHADDPGFHTRTKFLSMVAIAMGGVMSADSTSPG